MRVFHEVSSLPEKIVNIAFLAENEHQLFLQSDLDMVEKGCREGQAWMEGGGARLTTQGDIKYVFQGEFSRGSVIWWTRVIFFFGGGVI